MKHGQYFTEMTMKNGNLESDRNWINQLYSKVYEAHA